MRDAMHGDATTGRRAPTCFSIHPNPLPSISCHFAPQLRNCADEFPGQGASLKIGRGPKGRKRHANGKRGS